jgi:hypothetical protein
MKAIFAIVMLSLLAFPALADKPALIPVTFGAWKGSHANTFKSGLRRGLAKAKGCSVVPRGKARVVIEGEVTEQNGKFSVHVSLKSPKNDEIIESREYSFSKPTVSDGQANKMGREVTEMAGRAPE